MTHVLAYRLRNPDDSDEVYGEDIPEEEDALLRAQQLADFYQRPVEVCHVAMGHITRSLRIIVPGPLAPPPLLKDEEPE
jgi:hypothetical protein